MFGKSALLYYQSTGTRATWGAINNTTGRNEANTAPSNLVEIGAVKDLTLDGDRPSADQTDRGSNFATFDTGALRGGASFKLNARTTEEAGVTAIKSAWLLNETLAMAVLNAADDVTGTVGLWADFKVEKFVENQPEEGHIDYDVSIKPYDSGVDPEYVELIA